MTDYNSTTGFIQEQKTKRNQDMNSEKFKVLNQTEVWSEK